MALLNTPANTVDSPAVDSLHESRPSSRAPTSRSEDAESNLPCSPESEKSRGERVYFPHLDGLRFWAFFAVLLVHNTNGSQGAWAKSPAMAGVARAFSVGVFGVNFFFVLSGFLITFLLLTEHARKGRIDVLAFYVRRALRIWPLYFACVGAWYVAARVLMPGERLPSAWSFASFTANFSYIQNTSLPPEAQARYGPLGVLWSVGIEEQFYLAWPVLMALALALSARSKSRTSKSRTSTCTSGAQTTEQRSGQVAWLFAGVCVLSLGCRIAWREATMTIYYHTFTTVGDMALGAWAAWKCWSDPRWPARLARLSRSTIAAAYALLVLLLALTTWQAQSVWLQALGRPVFAALFAFVILEQCYAQQSLWKCGNSRLLSRLGTYSYGLYCLHVWALMISERGLIKLGLDSHLWQLFVLRLPLAFAIALALAMLSYHFYETPFLRLKRRFSHIQTT